jgi:hypothetical protein
MYRLIQQAKRQIDRPIEMMIWLKKLFNVAVLLIKLECETMDHPRIKWGETFRK